MEINGIKVDKKYLSNLSIKFSQRIKKLEQKIYKESQQRQVRQVPIQDKLLNES